MATRKSIRAAEEKFIDSLRESLDEAENLFKEAAEATGEKANELREKALHTLDRTRNSLVNTQDAVLKQGYKMANAADDCVHEHPWQAIAVAGVTGVILGALLTRR